MNHQRLTHTMLQSPDMGYYQFEEPVPGRPDCSEREPVGIIEIADRLGVRDRSVHKMVQRGRLPAPEFDSVNGSRAWDWRSILWWAGETRRLVDESIRQEYRDTFGLEPPIGRKRATRDQHPDLVPVPDQP